MDIETKSLLALEWSLICQALASRTLSPLGSDLAENLFPNKSFSESSRIRTLTREALKLKTKTPLHSFLADTQNVNESLKQAKRGIILSAQEIAFCGHFLSTVSVVAAEIEKYKELCPHWFETFEHAPKPPSLISEIRKAVTTLGEVLDSASPELARLRREWTQKKYAFESTLDSKVKHWHAQGLLQDSFYDLVDGRYVVPVRADQQGKLQGSLFSKSNTGQSVFIEPHELTQSNNAIKAIELEIHSEIQRILKDLSHRIGLLCDAYLPWKDVLAELDFTLASAQLCIDWQLNEPNINPHNVCLKNLFHPLLIGKNVSIVKNTVQIEAKPQNGFCLLISGPNTGGKTVLLKAIALAAAMTNAGLFIACDEGSSIAHYEHILAFIGDEQNLNLGLSSFSGQIIDMKYLLALQENPTLVVIDEMLSSTDPEQASALAQSILEESVLKKQHLFVTSHFSELSMRARQTPHFTVAAMEFHDGKPTYKIRFDEMGSSHALEIARRLGLSDKLLDRAETFLSQAKLDYEKSIEALKQKELEIEREYDERLIAFDQQNTIEKKQFEKTITTQLELFIADIEKRFKDSIEILERRFITQARLKMANEKNNTELKNQSEHLFNQELMTKKNELIHQIKDPSRSPQNHFTLTAEKPLAVGDWVKLKSPPLHLKNAKAQILEIKTSKNSALLAFGTFKLEKLLTEIYPIQGQSRPQKHSTPVFIEGSNLNQMRLDIRGKRFDDALSEAEHFIDAAFRNGYPNVVIITGHGTGALKKGLAELIKRLPYVQNAQPERTNDDGAMVVSF